MSGLDKVALNPQPLPPRTVRVMLTRDVAFDLGKMQKVTASILDRLGCGGCHSGHMIEFLTIQDFVVNPKTLEVQEAIGGLGR
jgi:hypothetical protein